MNLTAWVLVILMFGLQQALAQKKNAEYYFQKGEEALDSQGYKTALAHFNECLRLDPYYIDAYYYRAQARENLGDKPGALTDFNIYLEAKPKDTEALFSRALLRYQYRQWAMAREDFLKLLASPPGETKSIFFAPDKEGNLGIATTQSNSSILNYLGLVDVKMKNYKRALQYLDSAIKLESKNAEYYINRGWARQELLDTAMAMQDYQKALMLNPEGSMARYNIAVLTAKKGNLKEVEKLLTEAIERNPDEQHFFTARAINQTAQKNFTKALEDFNSSLQLDNRDADVWLRRGTLKMQLNNLTGALADFTESIKINDTNEKTWLLRGNLMMQMNRINEAIEDYTIAIVHRPDFGKAYYQRAQANLKAGNTTEACNDLKAAQQLNEPVESKMKSAICK
ncbi:MAG: tetratricopeptide repeat protein [Bacteroidetes bacterium]|jgi:tetratricopeptide (TPR) repeat protein|nr:tetratricopeptide repeat protein [Bacteroidota bacterium]MBS1981670.1 tetratricopeptide repeat protein [Bacteroidota bacterium]